MSAELNDTETLDIEPDEHTASELNKLYKTLNPRKRIERLYEDFDDGDILFTSSFGTNSSYLLYLLSEINPNQKVHFINTGYLFEETIRYKDELSERFKLEIEEILPLKQEHALTTEEQWWKDHPKMCCAINKIAPLDKVKLGKKIWVSGVLGFQTDFRSNLGIFAPHGDLHKFHPLIDMNEAQFLYEIGFHKLPQHPLADFGYGSIGCTHCTVKGEGREGRWADSEKTECGLHTHYFTQQKELNESK